MASTGGSAARRASSFGGPDARVALSRRLGSRARATDAHRRRGTLSRRGGRPVPRECSGVCTWGGRASAAGPSRPRDRRLLLLVAGEAHERPQPGVDCVHAAAAVVVRLSSSFCRGTGRRSDATIWHRSPAPPSSSVAPFVQMISTVSPSAGSHGGEARWAAPAARGAASEKAGTVAGAASAVGSGAGAVSARRRRLRRDHSCALLGAGPERLVSRQPPTPSAQAGVDSSITTSSVGAAGPGIGRLGVAAGSRFDRRRPSAEPWAAASRARAAPTPPPRPARVPASECGEDVAALRGGGRRAARAARWASRPAARAAGAAAAALVPAFGSRAVLRDES